MTHPTPRPLTALLLTALAAATASHAEPLPGEAELRVRVTVDAQTLTDRLDGHDAELAAQAGRLDAAERERAELRRAVAALAQDAPPVDRDPTVTPDPPPLNTGANGFLSFPKAPDARTVYVAADGNDRNHGRTPDAPMRTAAAAYQRLRDGRPDRLLFRAGDTFNGGIGRLNKSGRSAEQPLVIGVYGEGDRPRFAVGEDAWASKWWNDDADHVVFDGLHLVAELRRPGNAAEGMSPEAWRTPAFVLFGGSTGITIHDCKLEYFHFAIVAQSNPDNGGIRDFTLHRNIVRDSYGHWNPEIAHHSSGLYASYIDGLTITENLFDRNGWHPDVDGAKATKFNHNLYIQDSCTGNTVVRGNVLSRASAHALQLRAGGVIDDNLFLDNPLAFFAGISPSRVTRNVVLGGRDINDDPGEDRGFGFDIQPMPDALIEGNIVTQKRAGSAGHAHAIKIDGSDGVHRKMLERHPGSRWAVTFRDNRVYDWPRNNGPTVWVESRGVPVEVTGIEQTAIDEPSWADPGRDVESYMQTLGRPASVEAYLDLLTARPRGVWYGELAAAAVNDYVRSGFASGGR
ncbi:MAG: right-handed parallel beta-helix repeat-containing protein [Planctomycetota bacterium]